MGGVRTNGVVSEIIGRWVSELMGREIHALSIQARSPEESSPGKT